MAPERWPLFHRECHKLNFRRFPYAVVYSRLGDVIYVKAVMHLHRRPFYWQHRKSEPERGQTSTGVDG
jgi:hypothetical protein